MQGGGESGDYEPPAGGGEGGEGDGRIENIGAGNVSIDINEEKDAGALGLKNLDALRRFDLCINRCKQASTEEALKMGLFELLSLVKDHKILRSESNRKTT